MTSPASWAEKLRAEHAAELAGRRGQIGLTKDGDVVYEEPGIFDPFTGERLSPEEEAELEAQSQRRACQIPSGGMCAAAKHTQVEVPVQLPTSNVLFRCDDLRRPIRNRRLEGVEVYPLTRHLARGRPGTRPRRRPLEYDS
jgi:hypothetical protein